MKGTSKMTLGNDYPTYTVPITSRTECLPDMFGFIVSSPFPAQKND